MDVQHIVRPAYVASRDQCRRSGEEQQDLCEVRRCSTFGPLSALQSVNTDTVVFRPSWLRGLRNMGARVSNSRPFSWTRRLRALQELRIVTVERSTGNRFLDAQRR